MPREPQNVYTIHQRAYSAAAPGLRYDTAVFLLVRNESELDDVVDIFASGGEDARIVEQRLPTAVTDTPGLRVELLGLADADGHDLSHLFPQLPFARAGVGAGKPDHATRG